MSILLFSSSSSIIIIVVIWFGDLFVTQIMYLKHSAWQSVFRKLSNMEEISFYSRCLRCGICYCLWIVILVANLSFIESACRLILACRMRSLCHRKVDFMSILRTAVSKTKSKQDLSHCIVHCWCYVCTIKRDCIYVDPGWKMFRNSLVV